MSAVAGDEEEWIFWLWSVAGLAGRLVVSRPCALSRRKGRLLQKHEGRAGSIRMALLIIKQWVLLKGWYDGASVGRGWERHSCHWVDVLLK